MSFLWWRDGVIYQIYPRSFADSSGDGIGDLNGITARLDYLVRLGVDALWLSPIYPSPDVDFGYDVADYCAIDPKFGTMADFERLLAEAHARGLRIVLDLVLNHTSDQHPWFLDSASSPDSEHRDWYLWRKPRPGGRPPNNWQSVFGGGGWSANPLAVGDAMYFHLFYPQQPDLNWRNAQVRQAMLDVFRFWADKGVDGFRLDVFNAYFKHEDLPDNPPAFGIRGFERQRHVNDIDQPEMIPLLNDIRALLDSYPERYAVGETFLSTPAKAALYVGRNKLHAAFNFQMLSLPWKPAPFLASIQRWEDLLGSEDWPNYVLNNHDTRRAATRFRCGEADDARLKVAAALLLTLRGTPFLYYGEEIGMRDLPIRRKEDVQDPIGRHFWPFFKGRDGCRSPMQWDDTRHAGFNAPDAAEPWLAVHPNHVWRSVAAQEDDPGSLLTFYRRLLALRRATPALTQGMFLPVAIGSRRLLAYLRQTADQSVLVVLNFSRRRQRLVLGRSLARAPWKVLLSTHRDATRAEVDPLLRKDLLDLAPEEALILIAEAG